MAELLTNEVERAPTEIVSNFLVESSSRTIVQLIGAVVPEMAPDGVQSQEMSPLVTPRSVAQIRGLQRAGVVDIDQGEVQVPAELQLSVVAGTMLAVAHLREFGPDV